VYFNPNCLLLRAGSARVPIGRRHFVDTSYVHQSRGLPRSRVSLLGSLILRSEQRRASPVAFVACLIRRRQKTVFCPLLLSEASRSAELTHTLTLLSPLPPPLPVACCLRKRSGRFARDFDSNGDENTTHKRCHANDSGREVDTHERRADTEMPRRNESSHVATKTTANELYAKSSRDSATESIEREREYHAYHARAIFIYRYNYSYHMLNAPSACIPLYFNRCSINATRVRFYRIVFHFERHTRIRI